MRIVIFVFIVLPALGSSHDWKVIEGDDVKLQCSVSGSTNGLVIWTRNNSVYAMNREIFSPTANNRVVIEGSGSSEYNLVINDIRLEDEAIYHCTVAGEEDVIQTHRIKVQVPPTVFLYPDETEIDLILGDDVTLGCEATGKPEPAISWVKVEEGNSEKGSQVGSSATLNVMKVKATDTGRYICTASNGVREAASRSIKLNVYYKPSVIPTEGVIRVAIGGDTQLGCNFSANPKVEVNWLQNNSQFVPGQRHQLHTIIAKGNTPDYYGIKIRNIQPSDLGIYTCKGHNSLGTGASKILVTASPYDLEVTSSPEGPYSNEYWLEWRVSSLVPLISFELVFIKIENNSALTEFKRVNVSVTSPQQFPTHRQQYRLRNLHVNQTFTVQIRARNNYDVTSLIDSFVFHTSSRENVAPTTPERPSNGGRLGWLSSRHNRGSNQSSNCQSSLVVSLLLTIFSIRCFS